MDVFLACTERGVGREQAVAQHPDLAELLDLLYAGDERTTGADAADGGPMFGQFRIVRPLGRGGGGTVYEAHQSSLGRRVALKVLGEGAAATATQVARFRREALTLARLDHPHIVRIVDVGSTNGRHWLAMDLVEGRSLGEHLDALRATGVDHGAELRRLVEGIAQIAGALDHAHAAGILHRDVKPSNILVHRDGRMLLSDFGLARDDSAPTMTHAGTVVGTPNYMSPEQVVAAKTGPATDVFSLGATLYECLTLQRPFRGESTDMVLRAILTHDPPDPRRLRRGLPADLAAIVLKAIEKDPARRYATARAMADDLRAFLELQPVQARVPTLPQRAHRWLRREPLRGVAVALASAAILFGAWGISKQPELRAAESVRVEREFERLLSRGEALSSARRHDQAIADLNAALALRPNDGLAIASLAMALRRSGDGAAALAVLDAREATTDDPDLLRRTRACVLGLLGQSKEADALRSSLPPPRTPAAFWIAGTEALLATPGDRAAARTALAHLSIAVRLAPAPRLVWTMQWAVAAHLARDEAAAAECKETLLQHWPDDPLAQHYAALAMSRTEPRAALAMLLQARAGGAEPAESSVLEVFVRETMQDRAGLIEAVGRALAMEWDAGRHGALLDTLDRCGDREGFDAAASAWYREHPDEVEAMQRMAIALSWREDHDASIALFAAVAAERPRNAESRYDLAVAQHVAGRDEDTLHTLQQVIELDPAHARAHVRLLDLLTDAGEPGALLAEHRRWAAVLPRDAAASLTLARALLASSPPDADGALAAAVQADVLAAGRDADVLDCLANAHELLGEATSAQHCRQRAATLRAPAAGAADTKH